MRIPEGVTDVLEALNAGGYEACVVGGCVRDALLGREPNDWDVCTAARPEETARCLSGFRLFETGLQHGTVTVLSRGLPIEVTTFRVDGAYADHRRPNGVRFVASLAEDLARRDFTVNAMAFAPARGLIDPYGGRKDLAERRIRAVGDPRARFDEDALRILRAARFASTLDFVIDDPTAQAMREKKALLCYVSAERVYAELKKLLLGVGAERALNQCGDVLAEILPAITPCAGFAQRNPHHYLDVWAHTAASVGAIRPEPTLRLAMLFHDLGKPECFTLDEAGVGHFYGHAERSARIARESLEHLKSDTETRVLVTRLVASHGALFEATPRGVRRALNRDGEAFVRMRIEIARADACAQSSGFYTARIAEINAVEAALEAEIARDACFSLKKLRVNGHDLLDAGYRGAEIGRGLDALLSRVIDGTLENERDALMEAARGELEQIRRARSGSERAGEQ